jgi:hypothetical protein
MTREIQGDPLAAVMGAAWRLTVWTFGYRGRVREWRRTAAALGLTNVREVRTFALIRRVEAESGPLRVTFTSAPPREDESPRGSLVFAGVAPELSAPAERELLGGFDIPIRIVEVPPVAGPQLVLCALFDLRARRAVSALFTGHVEVDDGVERRWECRTRVGAGRLEIDYEGELLDDFVRGALRAARCLVPPQDAAAAAAENLRRETAPLLRAHILRTLTAEAPAHPATQAAVREALADGADAMRLEAALASGAQGRAVLRALVSSDDTAEGVLARAVAALDADLPSEELRALLGQAIRRRYVRVAIACLEQLGTRGPAETEALAGALESGDPGVVVAAAQALTRHGNTREAVIALREALALRRDDGELADAVRHAVAAIQQRLEKAGAGQLSVAAGETGTVSLSDDPQGRVALEPGDAPQS